MFSKISILFLLMSILIFPQNDIRILSSDARSLVFEYVPQYTDTSIITIEGKDFRNVVLSEGYVPDELEAGSPQLQKRIINVGVPGEYGNTFEILSASYKEIQGEVLPVPQFYKDGEFPAKKYSTSASYFNSNIVDELVSFGEYGVARGLKVQSFLISPVQFNASVNTIRLYSRILIRINFSGSAQFSKTPADDFASGAVINFDIAKYWVNETSARLNKINSNSVLATGRWFKFEAPEEGVYRITRSMLAQFGIDAATVDPRTIKIYNNGGKVLPEINTAPRPQDLVENAIIVAGENDGRFDETDYILFYGRESSFWDFDTTVSQIKRMRHTYSDKNYFWITSGGENGKRVQNKNSLNQTADFIQTTSAAFADYEVDKINLGKTGRQFFGDDFSSAVTSRTYMNNLHNRDNSEPIKYNIRFAIGTQNGMDLTLTDNGNQLLTQNLGGYGSALYRVGRAHLFSTTFNGVLPDNRSALTFKVNPSSVTAAGYLDYFEIEYKKHLIANGDNLTLFSEPNTGVIEYQLSGFSSSNIQVYDVSDFSDIKLVTPKPGWPSGSEFRFQSAESNNIRNKYIAVGNDNYKSPANPAEVLNSNLRGESTGAKFIIITHKIFMDAANRLKTYRESQSVPTISTIVVDVDFIYNEFSCGSMDVSAIRDYIKYAYDNWQIKPEYVLMFGKGTYDFRNVETYSDNFIPTWQSEESLILIFGGDSFSSDDFFVQVDGIDLRVDVALGRLPVSSVAEADNVIDKIIHYETGIENGNWQNLITLIADDGIGSQGDYEGPRHTQPTEEIAEIDLPGFFDKNKIYAAAFPEVITGQGRRKPAVNQAIIDAINNGTLFVNYIGHGSPELWAHEYIFEKSVALPLMQNDKYFFMCAATCDFGYFDIPNFQSSTEAMIFLQNRGAIAGISSSRLVTSGENHNLNKRFIRNIFTNIRDTLNLPVTLGRAVFDSKQTNFPTVNDRKYFLFGDPTLRLRIPQYFANVDSVNGLPLTSEVQIKALSRTEINGVVLRPDSTIWEDFSGEGLLTVFDSERLVRIPSISTVSFPFDMKVQGGVIFKGRVSIIDGRFSADFVVPKDISYENQNGKIVLLFYNNQSYGIGYTNNVIIGGTDTTANDGKGPEIEIYFDDISYGNSFLVGPDPKLIVKLFDETGLNTTGTGIGHKLEGVLNEQENNPIDFTNYFIGDLDAGGRSGQINYLFNNLEFGEYSLLVKAWDVFNNLSTDLTYFSVVNDNELVVRDVYNYPNPFTSATTFTFNQNLTQPIDVKIRIYTIAGRMIKEIEKFHISDRFVTIDWDGRDEDGSVIANGTYLYKVIVKTIDGNNSRSVTGKLAVIR